MAEGRASTGCSKETTGAAARGRRSAAWLAAVLVVSVPLGPLPAADPVVPDTDRVYQLFTIRLASGLRPAGPAELISPPGYFIQGMIDRAGEAVVFWGREPGEAGFNIWRHDLRTGERCKLTNDRAVNGHPFWTADGRQIVFFSTIDASDTTEWLMSRQFDLGRPPRSIWIMDRDGGRRRRLTRGSFVDERPCISPDGRTIVFVSDRSGRTNLWSVDSGGGEPRPVTAHDQMDYRPVFSPDGKKLAFFSSNNPGRTHALAILDWPANGPMRFPVPPGIFERTHGPFWLADGRTLLTHSRPPNGDYALFVYDLDLGQARRIEIPGFPKYAHGTIDSNATRLVFDSPYLPR